MEKFDIIIFSNVLQFKSKKNINSERKNDIHSQI